MDAPTTLGAGGTCPHQSRSPLAVSACRQLSRRRRRPVLTNVC